jgi:hypothetical protein
MEPLIQHYNSEEIVTGQICIYPVMTQYEDNRVRKCVANVQGAI